MTYREIDELEKKVLVAGLLKESADRFVRAADALKHDAKEGRDIAEDLVDEAMTILDRRAELMEEL